MLHHRLIPLHLERDCIVASVESTEGILHVRPTKRLVFFKLGSFAEARHAFNHRLCQPGRTLDDAIGLLRGLPQHNPREQVEMPPRWFALLEGSSLSEKGPLLVLREGIAAIRSGSLSKGPWNWLGIRTLDVFRTDGLGAIGSENRQPTESKVLPFKRIPEKEPAPIEAVLDLFGEPVANPARKDGDSPGKGDREHIATQAILLEISLGLEMKACVAINDGSTLLNGLPLSRHTSNVVDFSRSVFSLATFHILRLIDVAFRSRDTDFYTALFEVEHTTNIEKGVDRMLEVTLAVEGVDIPMFIVAERRRLPEFLKVLGKNKYRNYRDKVFFLETEQLPNVLKFIARAGRKVGVHALKGHSTTYAEHVSDAEMDVERKLV